MFWTVVNELKSPENAGMIVRSHVAFGGEEILIIGKEPWQFKKRARGFSRHLEKLCRFTHLKDEESFFQWCAGNSVVPIAIEITECPTLLPGLHFPARAAIVIGNEAKGLSASFLSRCAATVTISQVGPASLNAAVSASIVMYELTRRQPLGRAIVEAKYIVEEAERQRSNRRLEWSGFVSRSSRSVSRTTEMEQNQYPKEVESRRK